MTEIQTYLPSAELRTYVCAFWTGDFNTINSGPITQLVMPNGTIEMIIHLTEENCDLIKEGDLFAPSPGFTVIGLRTQAYGVRFRKRVKVFGIRFYPEVFQSIFALPSSSLLNTFEDSTQVFGSEIHTLCEMLREANNTTDRIRLTEKYICNQLHKRKKHPSYVYAAAELIRKRKGLINIKDLIRNIPISLRQLQRSFGQETGISPKEYIRITRLNAIHQYMNGITKPDFTDITYEFGFADQSHFIREFKTLTGEKPGTFLVKKNNIIVNPGFYGH